METHSAASKWGLRAINWDDARYSSADEFTVAVIDSGIDSEHPDFDPAEIGKNATELSPEDILGHGTHVCGVVAALTNNGIGVSGICHCRLAVWKVTPDEPDAEGAFRIETVRLLRALRAVADSGAKVVNLSLGGRARSREELDVLAFLERSGITVVAAMGNDRERGNPTQYPGAYPNVLAVGAVDEGELVAPYSNTGDHIGLVAPGTKVLSTVPTAQSAYRKEVDYAAWTGTSMATPHEPEADRAVYLPDEVSARTSSGQD
jgi:subtilisin family serine protease